VEFRAISRSALCSILNRRSDQGDVRLAEPDKIKAAVLYTIADEAERDVLCTVDSTNLGYTRRDVQKLSPNPKRAT